MLKGQIGKIWFSRIFEDEDLAEAIQKRTEESGVKAGFFMLIGSLKKAVIGYYSERRYNSIQLAGPLEIASCTGNVSIDKSGEILIHSHIVVANEKGEAFGGHLMKDSFVGATAELVIVEAAEVNLERIFDEKKKLNLWRLC